MKAFAFLIALLCAGPSAAQSVTGCSSVPSNRVATSKDVVKLQADADCFARAGEVASAARKVRLDRLAALVPKPVPGPAAEAPIASNFETKPLFVTGYNRGGSFIPPSAKPDVLGAFRFICYPGQTNWDDPIVYPGQRGGSPHLHQWFGNMTGRYDSTYATLRGAGDSTCSNMLNRSAYWVPAMLNAAGKVIGPDYISLYYKRMPASDPGCFVVAKKGCVALPFNFRAVSGYDMKRHGQAQPENQTFAHRCISPNKPSEHRQTLTQAIADCGGEGQIASSITFGNCWNGQLDSPDHRSHITQPTYGSWGYPKCADSYPYLIPELTQTIVYTIEKSDGEVYLASDRMPGMPAMAPGSSEHADYMAAWDPATQAVWENNCINKLLNCSDGELGDGTMLKRGGLTYKAATRLVDVPPRPTS